MSETNLAIARAELIAQCLLSDRPINVPGKGYWGNHSLAALAAAAIAVLRSRRR